MGFEECEEEGFVRVERGCEEGGGFGGGDWEDL
jgi:hypothetical protein